MLTVPLDCPFLIAPSVFANVYQNIQSVILFKGQKIKLYWTGGCHTSFYLKNSTCTTGFEG